MKRDYRLYLQDMRDCVLQIEEYLSGISEETFRQDRMLQDAVVRRLEIIGEASRNIPRVLKEKNKHIPWFDLSQFRDFISHAYFTLSLTTLWKTATERIPLLKEQLKRVTLV